MRGRVGEGIALAGILAAALGLRGWAASQSAPVDDAFITFRYAENLAAGHGFVFNPGERVLGTTTPLFTLLLAGLACLGLPVPGAGVLTGILADLVVIALVFGLLRPGLGAPAALVSAFAYATAYAAVAACGNGMETQVFLALVTGAFLAASRGRPVTAAGVAALAALTRPEGFLAAALAGGVVVVRHRRERPRRVLAAAGLFAAVTGGWFLFAALYFGSPVPHSVLAKAGQDGVGARLWLDFFVTRNPVVMLAWAGAAAGAVLAYRRRAVGALLLAGWLAAYAAFFLAARPPFFGSWYFPPAALSLFALSGAAAALVLGVALRSPVRGAAAAAAVFLAAAAVVLPRAMDSVRWNRRVAQVVYRPLAAYVADHTAPDAVVHASDIGYLGYFGGRRILDAASLVTPALRAWRERHAGDPDWDVNYVLAERPDWVVLPVQGGIYAKFLGSPFADAYTPAARFQVEGETDPRPPLDAADRYRGDPRFMADFIVYRRDGP